MLLLGVPPFVPFVVAFGGGPKSQGDELIVRTSRFLAAPEMKQKRSANEKCVPQALVSISS